MGRKQELDPNGSFAVHESRGVNIVFGLIFLVIFFSTLFTIEFNNFSFSSPHIAFLLTLFPAIFFFVKARRHKLIIEINAGGFYYLGRLITDWKHFISVKYVEEEKAFRISDNFVLLMEYFKPNASNSFIIKIKLGNTQNKSEEEIIEAIQFYHQQSGYEPMLSEE